MQINNQTTASHLPAKAQPSDTTSATPEFIFDTADELMQAINSLPEGATAGLRISSDQSVMHLLPLPVPLDASRLQTLELPEQALYSPEEYQQNMLGQASLRDTKAIIYLDGKAAVMQDGQGITSRNAVDTGILRNGGNFENLVSQLKSQYGSRISVEKFPPGTGPTNAEAFELFSGKDYYENIAEQVAGMRQEVAENQRRQLEYNQQQALWKNAPQDNVFKVNGQIIASVGEDGTANISTANLLYTLDSMDKERDVAKELFDMTTGKSVSSEDLQAFFDKHFAGQSSTETFSGDQRPSREAVGKQANAQYLSSYQMTLSQT